MNEPRIYLPHGETGGLLVEKAEPQALADAVIRPLKSPDQSRATSAARHERGLNRFSMPACIDQRENTHLEVAVR